jgi:pyruvate dehydrogenase E2 component (dihydrolipoyllysine-residue acetyltransferase)
MATDIIMPALGMAQETGTLVRWLKHPGEEVTKGEPLMEVETDKAVVEVESPATGILGLPLAEEGAEVPVGQPIGHVLAPGETAPAGHSAGAGPAENRARLAAASPKARRLARERRVDLAAIAGSGPMGAVLAADLPAAASTAGVGQVWRLMAERTTASWTTAPHFFLMRAVNAGRLVSWRTTAPDGVTYSDLLVYLIAASLRRHPEMNATWQQGRAAREPDVNLSLAIAVEEGLVAPVIHDADRLSLAEIAEARQRLVEKARNRRLAPADLAGGTFTLSNLGMFGVDAFTAILNESQAGILAAGRIVDDVCAVEGRVEIRPRMVLSLSCDHRMVDGARGARFLDTLSSLIEEPLGLLTRPR